MTSKCWFTLKQNHYPPPIFPRHGIGKVSGGPICPGHLIPDLKHLDNVINRHGPLDIPSDMPIYHTKAWDLTFDSKRDNGIDLSAIADVPIAAAVGVNINLDAGVAFKKTKNNFWEFDSLDTFVIQPTREYIEDSLEDTEVAAYLKSRSPFGSSSLFMVTGVIIARGAKSKNTTSRERSVRGNPGVDVPILAEAGIKLELQRERGISSTTKMTSDFVWAIRLAKISKGILDRTWSHVTYSSGATFGLDDDGSKEEAHQIVNNLKVEGFEGFEGFEDPYGRKNDDVFVVGTEG